MSAPRAPDFVEVLAELLWEEGKFPGGGARTSRERCKIIVAKAVTRCANQEPVRSPDNNTKGS